MGFLRKEIKFVVTKGDFLKILLVESLLTRSTSGEVIVIHELINCRLKLELAENIKVYQFDAEISYNGHLYQSKDGIISTPDGGETYVGVFELKEYPHDNFSESAS